MKTCFDSFSQRVTEKKFEITIKDKSLKNAHAKKDTKASKINKVYLLLNKTIHNHTVSNSKTLESKIEENKANKFLKGSKSLLSLRNYYFSQFKFYTFQSYQLTKIYFGQT